MKPRTLKINKFSKNKLLSSIKQILKDKKASKAIILLKPGIKSKIGKDVSIRYLLT